MTYATMARRWGSNIPGRVRPDLTNDGAPAPGAPRGSKDPVRALERELTKFVDAVGGTRYRPL